MILLVVGCLAIGFAAGVAWSVAIEHRAQRWWRERIDFRWGKTCRWHG